LGALGALFSLVSPKANLPIYVGLSVVAYPIGLVLANVILGALFYGLITPVGLVFRLMGRDSLQRKFEPEARTYWEQSKKNRSLESYFKQF
jgi:multisubunit Na+/H+ antiporter MnhG subunit